MKILYYATIDFYTRPNPSFHLMLSMLEDVLEQGHTVYLLGCKDISISKHIPESLLKNDGFTYNLVPVKPIKKSHFVRRYLSGINYALKTRKVLKHNKKEFDIVFIQSSPTVVFNIKNVKKFLPNAKIVYNIQDMFPGSSIASGIMNRKWMQKFFCSLQKKAYKNADKIVVISQDMKNKVIEQGVNAEKIEVIVNWFDNNTVRFINWENNKFVSKYILDSNKFYIQYAGTMGYVFDYKMVLNIAQQLKKYEDIEFQMIGEGSQKQIFIDEAEALELSNVKFFPLQSQEMVSDVYSACSVCLIPLKKGVIGNSVPSKAGLLMACKKPIVSSVDEDSDFYKMINENKIGRAVGTEKPKELSQAILKLYNDRNLCQEYGQNGYNYGHELYSRSNNMKKYLKLFEEISEKS